MATAMSSREVILPSGASSPEPVQPKVLPQEVPFKPNPFDVELHPRPYSALPEKVLFGALRHPALKLRKPIPLQTGRTDSGISVFWDETQEFGHGETFSAAVDDFSATLAELYFQLEHGDAPLSDYLQGVRNKLTDYIEVRPQ